MVFFQAKAWAHQVNVFAWVEGETIHVQGKFARGKKIKGGKIAVSDLQGSKLVSGLTDDQGRFSFQIPKRTDLKIVLDAGQGHRGEWTVHASEMKKSTREVEMGPGVEPREQTARDTFSPGRPAAEVRSLSGQVERNELEAVVEAVLDRKLAPIRDMLVDARSSGPTFRDIMAGIGYILGLVGVAGYVYSRKKDR